MDKKEARSIYESIVRQRKDPALLEYIDRNDLVALTREAAEISGIPYVMDSDREEIDRILG